MDTTSRHHFDPARNDYFVRALYLCLPKHPLLVAILYTLISFGGTILLVLLWSAIWPQDDQRISLFSDYTNIVNFAIVLPLAVVLVLNFYARVGEGFVQLVEDRIIVFENDASADRFLTKIDDAMNRKWFFYTSLVLAVACYATNLAYKEGYWNSGFGGPGVWWFRLFTIVNISTLFHLGFKAIVVARAIRWCFQQDITLQPLHPDGCGGLRSLGGISLAMNYMIGIIAAYLSVLAFMDSSPLRNPLFLVMILAYCLIAAYLFFVPLTDAHDLMFREKRDILSALNREFQETYARVSADLPMEGISLKDAQKIDALERLHRIASRMPVWPMDTRIVGQFFLVIAIPIVVGVTIESLKQWFL